MTSQEIRQQFIDFFKERGHVRMPPSSLVAEGDPSVLFTVAGMQQFKDYYSRPELAYHPRICTVQPVIRTVDIEEVGDNRHNTLFEMLGYFSFGFKPGSAEDEYSATPYFKKVAIKEAYDFYFNRLGLSIDSAYVTVYSGSDGVPKDEESAAIWRQLGLPENKIRYESDDNFWTLGPGNPCGPTTEIYIDDIEVGNVVFNQYFMELDGRLTPLEYLGVDTGLGLERIAIVSQSKKDVYETDLFSSVLEDIKQLIQNGPYNERSARIVADHLKAAMFLIADGVRPSNKMEGYVLRRLIRRLVMKAESLNLSSQGIKKITDSIYQIYANNYDRLSTEYGMIQLVLSEEQDRFAKTLRAGLRAYSKLKEKNKEARYLPIDQVFKLFDTYGFPIEITQELADQDGFTINIEEFQAKLKAHQALSRAGIDKVFKGGLADHEPPTVKHHTAHHLLLAALRQVLGNHVLQRGSHVTSERLRLDFSHPEKVSDDNLKRVEQLVNHAIANDLEVKQQKLPRLEAEKLGALAEFGSKYPSEVSVYTIENKDGSVFSREFCGGPHVERTSELGYFKILKEEASSAGVRRIKAKLEL